jgi:hypothetical protein
MPPSLASNAFKTIIVLGFQIFKMLPTKTLRLMMIETEMPIPSPTIPHSFIDKAEERVVLSMKVPGQHSYSECLLYFFIGKDGLSKGREKIVQIYVPKGGLLLWIYLERFPSLKFPFM